MKRVANVLVCGFVACLVGACGGKDDSPKRRQGDAGQPIVAACDGSVEEEVVITSANHIDGDIVYPDPPPAGGDHNPCWATWGVHTDPVPDELWVHNLEHGGIVYLYNCPSGCDAEKAELASFADGKSFVLVTPYSEMSKKFAAVAWGWRLVTDCVDMDAFAAFYDEHVDQAPESISSDPPSSCP